MADIGNIKWVDINTLKPYENNAKKHSDKQLDLIAKSINEFGFISPVLIDESNILIAGHGRVEASKRIGLRKVPCLNVKGMSEDQKRAYVLADNRLTEMGGWDKELVSAELNALNLDEFDISLTGFDVSMLDYEPPVHLYYGDERERTISSLNLDIVGENDMTNDFWQMPIIYNDGFIPERLIGFNYAKTSEDKNVGIHFYLDDYQFERVWNKPEKYVDILREYECILSPDFSIYIDMPMPVKIWNIYRSRQIGAFYQSQGIKVIPSVEWGEENTYEFAFSGLPKGSTVAISNVSVKKNKELAEEWKKGLAEMIRRVEPSAILFYDGTTDFDFGDIPVKYYKNEVLKRWVDR